MEPKICTSPLLTLGKLQTLLENLGPLLSRNKNIFNFNSLSSNDFFYSSGTSWIIQFQVNDLTLFFLKYIWSLPANHYLCFSRLFLNGFLSINASK